MSFRLHSLLSLSLHNNLLTFLPRTILSLVHLQELSLRGNPLVVRFIKDMTYNPPSLLELSGRTIKSNNLLYLTNDLPSNLIHYLNLASECPNPKCAGRRPNRSVTVCITVKFLDVQGALFLVSQVFTSTRAWGTSSLWISVGSTACRSCITSVLLSAPLRAAQIHRAKPSRRTRTAYLQTDSKEYCWDRTDLKQEVLPFIWFRFITECVHIYSMKRVAFGLITGPCGDTPA